MAQNLMGAASALPQVLVSQQIATAETTQYTCPASSSVKILGATITNGYAGAVTVSLSLVKSGGVAGAGNRVLASYSIASGDSVILSELVGHMLGPGDFVSGIAGTASAVVLTVSGVVFS